MRNILLNTDSYKHSHHLQLPPTAQRVSSYIEARRGPEDGGIVLFFGLQAFIRSYLAKPLTHEQVDEAKAIVEPHGLPFNEAGWRYIVDKHGGYLPVEIQALTEGSVVPRGTPLVQLSNTDPNVPWLASLLETAMLRSIWYPSTVATADFLLRTIIYDALLRSSDDPEGQMLWKLHDFGARGVSSSESAALGGMAHLINFAGTDTIEGIVAAREFYDAAAMPGFSIPASEHSTMTAWGRENEATAYRNMIEVFGDKGTFAIVSDSYDLFNAVKNIYGGELKDQIEDMKGTLVIRPDSGDPTEVPIVVLNTLWDSFGGTTNSKGYKVLNPKVRVIQGDGMNPITLTRLVQNVLEAGFALDNIAFGMGGKLLQDHTRDDLRFAQKANAIDLGNGWQDVYKDPAADPYKKSKAGRQAVISRDGAIVAIREDEYDAARDGENHLQTVFRDGQVLRSQTFQDVRDNAYDCMIDFHRHFAASRERALARLEEIRRQMQEEEDEAA